MSKELASRDSRLQKGEASASPFCPPVRLAMALTVRARSVMKEANSIPCGGYEPEG